MTYNKNLNAFQRWNYKRSVRAGNAARSKKDWSTACAAYRVSLALVPTATHLWVQLGHAAKEKGDFDAAQQAYETARDLDPADIDLLVQLGHLYKEMGQHSKARSQYDTALKAGSNDIHAIDYLWRRAVTSADEAREKGQLKIAAVLYRDALELRPEFGIYMHLGACLRDLGELDVAEHTYNSALELRPNDADCLARLKELHELANQQVPGSNLDELPHGMILSDPREPATRKMHLIVSENVLIILERIQSAYMHRMA